MNCTCDELRELTERCEQLADDVDAGREQPQRLMTEVTHLRASFEAHRQTRRHTFDDEGTQLPSRGLDLTPTSELRLVLSALRSQLAVARCAVGVRISEQRPRRAT